MRELASLLIPYMRRHKVPFAWINICTIIAALVQTLVPLKVSQIIDGAVSKGNMTTLMWGVATILGLGLADMLMNMGQRYASVQFSQRIIYDIRQDLFSTLQSQEMEFYAKESVGQIMARTIQEVFSMREILAWGYRLTFLFVCLFIGAFIAIWQIAPVLSLVFVLILPLVFAVSLSSSASNQQKFYDARFKYGELNEALAENLSGMLTVKSFGREQEQIDFFLQKNKEFYKAAYKTVQIRALLQPGTVLLISVCTIGLVLVGGTLVADGSISAGEFTAFMLLVLQMAIPGRFIGWLGIIAQDANSAAVRLNEVFKAPTYIKERGMPIELYRTKGAIHFDGVSFNYPGYPHTLKGVDLRIPAGQKVALLGPTGAGKSTLINLLPRLFDPDTGAVRIDDTDIKDVSLRTLRHNIGIVHQEVFLFTLSIHDNIAFGDPSASRESVIEAAKAAHIHDFVATLEEGYDTIVGERGVTLSGGQRQRIAIARTLLLDPPIMIFDDSVSAVDPETEAKIQTSLREAASKRTTIVISQRPSSLRFVDRILVMDNGRIVQDGSHELLHDQPGIYRDFMDAIEHQVKFMDWNQSDNEEAEAKNKPEPDVEKPVPLISSAREKKQHGDHPKNQLSQRRSEQ